MQIRTERMSDFFVKHHVEGLPFAAVFHHFTGPDGGDPHDHPWSFETHILRGGYVEEIYDHKTGLYEVRERVPGTAHRVEHYTIHRVVDLPQGECWTLILPEESDRHRTVNFWRWIDDEIWFRPWYSNDFYRLDLPEEPQRLLPEGGV